MNGTRHTFADNRSVTIAEAVNAFSAYDGRHSLAIATGYFNPGGFAAIADALERSPQARILIGAEPNRSSLLIDSNATAAMLELESPRSSRDSPSVVISYPSLALRTRSYAGSWIS